MDNTRVLPSILISSYLLFVLACDDKVHDTERRNEMDRPISDVSTSSGPLSDKKEARDFLNEETDHILLELKVAEIAIIKSENPKVRDLARDVQKNYGEIKRQLSHIAQRSRWDITIPHAREQKLESRLKDKSGKEFDAEILDLLISNQEEAIQRMEEISPNRGSTGAAASGSSAVAPDTLAHHTASTPDTHRDTGGQANSEAKPKVADDINRLNREPNQHSPNDKGNTPMADGDLEGWIANTLPVMRQQLEQCREVQEELQ